MSVISAVRQSRLEDDAHELLKRNRISGHSSRLGLTYAYTCPSPGRYPYQWFWDSCFHAIVLSHWEPEWAQQELRSLASVQTADGFIPHVIFWQSTVLNHYWKLLQADALLRPRMTAYIQPPALALAALRVFQATRDEDFGRQMLVAARRFHEWLRSNRDPDRDGLISIVSPFESGMDWSPQFDALFRGKSDALWLGPRLLDLRHWLAGHRQRSMLSRFDVEEIGTNSIWYDAQTSLAELARQLNDHEIETSERQGAALTHDALLSKCWDADAGAFFSLAGEQERKLRVRTAASLTPLLLDGLSPHQIAAVTKDVEDATAFATPFPIPSVATREDEFRNGATLFHWRGPTWINMNWLVVRGLLKHGKEDCSSRIVEASVRAVETSGFRECFEPYTGAGMGASNFGWTTLIVDMLRLMQ